MQNFFNKKKIFLTGHTGFKGSWLALILAKFGADVVGFAKEPSDWDSSYKIFEIDKKIKSIIGDLDDLDLLQKTIENHNPDIIFHLAAQPIVLRSYKDPIETWKTNVMGTLNVFEATKNLKNLRAIVNITTDKCYKNKEWCYPYRENDQLGGHDPYSASKAAVEILADSYRNSFFKKRGVQMANARGGNVVGGGDFGESRLLPSIVHSIKYGSEFIVRKPDAVRPWQHVIDILNGYMMIAKKIYENDNFDLNYNIAPDNMKPLTVAEIAQIAKQKLPQLNVITKIDPNDLHEAGLLTLDNSFIKQQIGWKPLMTNLQAIDLSFDWYTSYLKNDTNLQRIAEQQIDSFFYAK